MAHEMAHGYARQGPRAFPPIQRRLGKRDPLEALAEALEGRYDRIVKTVRSDVARTRRPSKRTGEHEVEIVFLESPLRADPDSGTLSDVIGTPEPRADHVAEARERLVTLGDLAERDLAEGDHRIARLIVSALEGDETQADIAARWWITDRNVRYMIEHLRRRFPPD
jgi:hypothetical protein